MGRSLRVFFMEEDETVVKIPLSKFQRFYDGDPNTAFPDYAGKVIRCAMAHLELDNRQPVGIHHIDFMKVYIDPEGRRDQEKAHEEFRLANSFLEGSMRDEEAKVISIEPYLARKRLKEYFRWMPTESQISAVLNKAMG